MITVRMKEICISCMSGWVIQNLLYKEANASGAAGVCIWYYDSQCFALCSVYRIHLNTEVFVIFALPDV